MKLREIANAVFNIKHTTLYKALFYKTDIPADKIRKEWALRPIKALPTPGMYRRYSEITWGMTFGAAIGAMFLSASLLWMNIPGLPQPTPLNTVYNGQDLHIDSSIETHLAAWIKLGMFEITTPLHSHLTPDQLFEKYPDIMGYKFYMSLMSQAGLSYLLWLRFTLIAAATALAGIIAFCNSHRFLFKTEFVIEKEGAKVYEAETASKALNKFLLPQYKIFAEQYTRFAEIADGVYAPEALRRTHAFIVGNSGAGKSQIAKPMIDASIKAGLKTVILDPGSEWTKYLFNENDPTIALIDPTDARSHVWKFVADMKGIGFWTKFVASVIPSQGKDPMWANAARMVNVALFLFIQETFGDDATFQDVADAVQLNDEQIAHIVNKFYPHAARLVGELTDEGIEQNQTVSGIMINMISFMEYFMDLARFWNKPSDKTISLYRFMTEPDYPIKTIIIRPNESEKRLARGITANMLAYMMNFIKEPELYGSKTVPVGNFFLDEFQSVGKIEDDSGDPVMQTPIQQARKYGWGLFLLTQTIPEAERIYGKETVAGWRGTMGTQILAGAPLDENINSWINGFGDKKIEKFHQSQSTASNGDVSYSGNWQEHVGKVMVASELTDKLRNEDPWIKYLYIPTGAKDLYFLRKKYDHIGDNYKSFVRAQEQPNRIKNTSRVLAAAKQIAKGIEPTATLAKTNTVAERFAELDKEYADMDDLPYTDGEPLDEPEYDSETTLNRKFVKEYDITPTVEADEDSLESDAVKDKITEILTDSHAINTFRQLYELLISSQSKKVKTTNPYEKAAFENKKRYGNTFTGLQLNKEKETN